eukprot:TRINITY_DN60129_c0_g1_i2.p1 TRINITY_DN60129_c0_g1~~TRINITY_DN60129_c0_g1_i2.p1  ORF type:complete len:127 (+),score=20.27 TRINITY_DN60129_c0_g1_i2:56-382(+)
MLRSLVGSEMCIRDRLLFVVKLSGVLYHESKRSHTSIMMSLVELLLVPPLRAEALAGNRPKASTRVRAWGWHPRPSPSTPAHCTPGHQPSRLPRSPGSSTLEHTPGRM